MNSTNASENSVEISKGLILRMMRIPSGTFLMGSPEVDGFHYKDEFQHKVTISRDFYMSNFTVTQEQWEALMGKNPSENSEPNFPVTDINWEDCQDFITILNSKTSGGFRLPTEAEWEYSCRAGTTTSYYFGEVVQSLDANFSGISKPVPVGSYKPNAFGLYDMHGNVWEWCSDWYGIYSKGDSTDPQGPNNGSSKVLRGGCFGVNASVVRSANRGSVTPTLRFDLFGLRLARTSGF